MRYRYHSVGGILVILLVVISSCTNKSPTSSKSEGDPTLSVNPDSVYVGAVQGEKELTISNTGSGNLKWTVSDLDKDWLSITPMSGSAAGTTTISYDKNETINSRMATLSITSNGGNKKVFLQQDFGQKISVKPDTLNFDFNQGEKKLSINNIGKDTLKWEISAPDNAWLSVSSLSGTDDGMVTISCTKNETGQTRSSSVLVKSNGGNEQIFIQQVYGAKLVVTPDTINVNYKQGKEKVNISNFGNEALEWRLSDPGKSWLNVSPITGTGDGNIVISYEQNDTKDPRSTSILFNSNGGNKEVRFTQKEAKYKIVSWGYNGWGQTDVPSGLDDVTDIAAGEGHTLALRSDGTVVAWGLNEFGQIDVPSGLDDVVAVGAGTLHSLALRSDGTIVAWGDASNGKCDVPSGMDDIIAVDAGGGFSMALHSDGTVSSWGIYGVGTMYQIKMPSSLSNVTAIAAGGEHSLALRSDGTVIAWGDDFFGQCDMPAGLDNVTAIAAGGSHSIALRSDGTIVAWGGNDHGQISVPVGLNNIKAIAAGQLFSLALKKDGTIVAWGDNNYGQCNIPTIKGDVVAITAGQNYALALVRTP